MEGSVQWDISISEKTGSARRYLMRGPRSIYRSALGSDLPSNIPIGSIRSEGNPVLTWNGNSLSSPTMTYMTNEQVWQLEGPVFGTIPGGTFSAGVASG
jgi:hypothetical protein